MDELLKFWSSQGCEVLNQWGQPKDHFDLIVTSARNRNHSRQIYEKIPHVSSWPRNSSGVNPKIRSCACPSTSTESTIVFLPQTEKRNRPRGPHIWSFAVRSYFRDNCTTRSCSGGGEAASGELDRKTALTTDKLHWRPGSTLLWGAIHCTTFLRTLLLACKETQLQTHFTVRFRTCLYLASEGDRHSPYSLHSWASSLVCASMLTIDLSSTIQRAWLVFGFVFFIYYSGDSKATLLFD